MKQSIISILVFFLSLFAYTKLVGPLPFTVTSTTTQKTDTFTVTGEGKTVVIPNMARISVGVQSAGKTVKDTQRDMNAKIQAVSSSIKGLGIDEKDIKTTNYSLYPLYDYNGNTQKITGYQANSTLSITIHDIEKTNDVVDSATHAGANTVSGLTFDLADKTQALSEAREKAVSEAKKKAQEAAKIAGFRLGKIINYTESEAHSRQPMPVMAMEKADVSQTTQIEAGSSEIQLAVTLSYQLE